MSEFDDELRGLLQRKADEVPQRPAIPRSVVRRARRRIAVNALGALAVVTVLAAGAYAGVRTLGGPVSERPGGGSNPRVAVSAGASATAGRILSCAAGQLDATAALQGAAGSQVGSLRFENRSNLPCLLRGRPSLMVDPGVPASPQPPMIEKTQPWWQVDGLPQPAGWPIVLLEPGRSAVVRFAWNNWCPSGPGHPNGPASWRITLDGEGLSGPESLSPPPCMAPDQPARFEVGPFEPAADEPSTTSPPVPTVTPLPTVLCSAAQIRATGSLQGAAGSQVGSVLFTNLSDQACVLTKQPKITLLSSNRRPLSGYTILGTDPWWKVNRSPEPAGWPMVTVPPGEVAAVRLAWSNWCGNNGQPPLWSVSMPGGGSVDVNGIDSTVPPCNGPGQPSTIQEGPFEPKPPSF